MAVYQQRIARHYNAKVRPRRFRIGDFVLRRVFQNTQELNTGKLGPIWEGPYRVLDIPRPGTYTLQSQNCTDVPRNWSSVHLCQYFYMTSSILEFGSGMSVLVASIASIKESLVGEGLPS
ncbi:hypothetical protein FNV43_RR00517 [Rhamnella rubrinervis]|uniref:Reverse transcriptase domain-containing protein n=1 Tax=Rhamnella rubrinervis TaxID=2594499 RepID=A0A8K0HNU0_9ROSA|nr:hypothetical protein FNV43_RR00517 [Rhamnella rubrinervis]